MQRFYGEYQSYRECFSESRKNKLFYRTPAFFAKALQHRKTTVPQHQMIATPQHHLASHLQPFAFSTLSLTLNLNLREAEGPRFRLQFGGVSARIKIIYILTEGYGAGLPILDGLTGDREWR